MFLIKFSIHSKKKDVIEFLDKMNLIIKNEKFDIDNNIIFISKKKENEKETFSTPYTMIDLDYNICDVVNRLIELTVQEYSETLFDRDDDNPPLLFVFGKDINCKTVYIKIKIREYTKKYCVYRFIMQSTL